jgi:tetratricopeptide (TPR) repeat protein
MRELVETLKKIRNVIDKGYKELEKLSAKLISKYGESEFVYELDEEDEEGHKFIKLEIIDKFIEANPKIAPVKENDKTPVNIGKNSDEPTHLMTETLAKVYLEQKKYAKAIQAYEILILKYPEKSSFFADRIQDIKDLQQNNN